MQRSSEIAMSPSSYTCSLQQKKREKNVSQLFVVEFSDDDVCPEPVLANYRLSRACLGKHSVKSSHKMPPAIARQDKTRQHKTRQDKTRRFFLRTSSSALFETHRHSVFGRFPFICPEPVLVK
jgi:hypothetical protein